MSKVSAKKIKYFIKTAIFVILSLMVATSCCGCLLVKNPNPVEYEFREVGDFQVIFFEDHCEIYGATEQGKNKRFLVVPEYIDGVRVDAFGYRSILGGFDVTSQEFLTCPIIESDVLEKIYIESTIYCYPWLGNGYIGSNLKKVIYPPSGKLQYRLNGRNVYYPRAVYENLVPNFYEHPANVSYYYNYDGAKDNGYYWIDDCEYGGKIEYIPKDPIRDGYVFGGWYKEPECINVWDFDIDTLPDEKKETVDDDDKSKQVTIYQETVLYAKWETV